MNKGSPAGQCLCRSTPQQTEKVTGKINIVSACACSIPGSADSKLCGDAPSTNASISDGPRVVPPGHHGTGQRPSPSDAVV